MKIRPLTYLLSLLCTLSIVPYGCNKPEGGEDKPEEPVDPPVEESDFSVKVKKQDGIRLVDSVKLPIECVLEVVAKNEYDNFEIVYSVAGKEEKTIKSMWAGKGKDISSDFAECKNYGAYPLSGYIYNTKNKENKQKFETVVWMLYVDTDIETAALVTSAGSKAIDGDISFPEGQKGTLEITYSPVTSYLNIEPHSSDESVLAFTPASASNKGGKYSIPFELKKTGKASLTVNLINGESHRTLSASVEATKQDTPLSVQAKLKTDAIAVPGMGPLNVVLDASCTQTGRRFDIVYSVDGTKVGETKDVEIKSGMQSQVNVASLSAGAHTISVVITLSGDATPLAQDSASFQVVSPVLKLTAGDKSVEVGSGQTVEVGLGTSYSVTIPGVEAASLSALKLTGAGITGSAWPYTYKRTSAGTATITLSFNEREGATLSFNTIAKEFVYMTFYGLSEDTLTAQYNMQRGGSGAAGFDLDIEAELDFELGWNVRKASTDGTHQNSTSYVIWKKEPYKQSTILENPGQSITLNYISFRAKLNELLAEMDLGGPHGEHISTYWTYENDQWVYNQEVSEKVITLGKIRAFVYISNIVDPTQVSFQEPTVKSSDVTVKVYKQ